MEAVAYGCKIAISGIGGPKYYFKDKGEFIMRPGKVNNILLALKNAYSNLIVFVKLIKIL